jgi:hypothetical protein
MKKQLNTKEQWFADTQSEAEKIVLDAKEEFPDELIGYSIQEKSNKSGEYFLVKLDMKFNTPAGIMESELVNGDEDDVPEWDDNVDNENDENTTTEDDE